MLREKSTLLLNSYNTSVIYVWVPTPVIFTSGPLWMASFAGCLRGQGHFRRHIFSQTSLELTVTAPCDKAVCQSPHKQFQSGQTWMQNVTWPVHGGIQSQDCISVFDQRIMLCSFIAQIAASAPKKENRSEIAVPGSQPQYSMSLETTEWLQNLLHCVSGYKIFS